MTRTLPVAAIEGETVDQLVWRTLKRAAPVVEQVLNLNPGLADQGCFLRHGQTVLVPADATRTAPLPMVQLWS